MVILEVVNTHSQHREELLLEAASNDSPVLKQIRTVITSTVALLDIILKVPFSLTTIYILYTLSRVCFLLFYSTK